MAARLSTEKKQAYAQEQFEELCRMGLTKRVAGKLMSTVGPALAVETLQWLMSTWEVFERWITNLRQHKHHEYLSDQPDCEETRDEIRDVFFKDNTRFPRTPKGLLEYLKLQQEEYGSNALEFGLTLPPPDKHRKMLEGIDIILEHLPLRR